MHATESRKVPDGKLIRVAVTFGEEIEDVELRGDFFLEPPEALTDLEAALEGHPVDVEESSLAAAVEAVDAKLIGFTARDLAALTLEAVR